ncbi:MAG: hypothetical protein M3Q03_01650 [Chloroflexota bacterium]|nr:hypothetical protein [Chloroflexota bacterium]
MNPDDTRALVDMAIRLRVCLDRAWNRLMSLPPLELASWGPRSRANVLHDYWTEAVKADFASDPWALFIEDRGLKQLVTEFMRVRFKKVNGRRLVAGNRTRRSQEWTQLPIPGITPLLSLSFVYQADAAWSEIKVAGLALQIKKSVPWFLEVGPQEEDDVTSDEGESSELPSSLNQSPFRVKRHVLEVRQAELYEETDDATGKGGHA